MQDLDLEKLEDSEYLLDVLIDCENVLDSLDLYCYFGWFDGEVVKGPIIRRHWVTFSLKYPHNKMPDPRAALRLLKHGVQVEFNSMKQKVEGTVATPEHEPNAQTDWLVTITIPRSLMTDTEEADLESYDDEVNSDDVEAAQDIGLDDESSYQEDEQLPQDDAMAMEQPPAAAPPAPPAGQPPR